MPNKLAMAKRFVNSSSSSYGQLASASIIAMETVKNLPEIYEKRRTALARMVEEEKLRGGKRGAHRRVAERLKMDPSHLSQVILGNRKCGEELSIKIGAVLQSPEWWNLQSTKDLNLRGPRPFDQNVVPAEEPIRTVPLISSVAAGRLTEITDPYALGACEKEIAVLAEVSRFAFALRITGNSMVPEYADGDIVIIDPQVTPQPGDCVVAKNHEHEATFKKFRPRGRNEQGVEYFELVPLNPDYPTLRSDVEHLRIIGTEVQHNRIKRPRKV